MSDRKGGMERVKLNERSESGSGGDRRMKKRTRWSTRTAGKKYEAKEVSEEGEEKSSLNESDYQPGTTQIEPPKNRKRNLKSRQNRRESRN